MSPCASASMFTVVAIIMIASLPCPDAKSSGKLASERQKPSSKVRVTMAPNAGAIKPGKARGAYLQTNRALMAEAARFVDHSTLAEFTEPAKNADSGKAEMFLQTERALKLESTKVVMDHDMEAPTMKVIMEEADPRLGEACSFQRGRRSQTTSSQEIPLRRKHQVALLQNAKGLGPMDAVDQDLADPFAGLDDAFGDGLLLDDNMPATPMDQKRPEAASSDQKQSSFNPDASWEGTWFARFVSLLLEVATGALVAKSVLNFRAAAAEEKTAPPSRPRQTEARKQKIVAALARAARSGDADRIACLLAAGADPNGSDDWGCAALHVAADNNSIEAAKTLVEKGAVVDIRDSWEETPLHFAARSAGDDMCKLLLDKGAAIDAVDVDGQTALLKAAAANKTRSAELLLSRGAGVGHVRDDELPPLLSALLTAQMLHETGPRSFDEVEEEIKSRSDEDGCEDVDAM